MCKVFFPYCILHSQKGHAVHHSLCCFFSFLTIEALCSHWVSAQTHPAQVRATLAAVKTRLEIFLYFALHLGPHLHIYLILIDTAVCSFSNTVLKNKRNTTQFGFYKTRHLVYYFEIQLTLLSLKATLHGKHL